MGINTALSLVEQTGNLPVPLHLRNAPTKLMKELGIPISGESTAEVLTEPADHDGSEPINEDI